MIDVTSYGTTQEAAAALGETAHFLGGGTILMRQVNYANPNVTTLVRLARPILGGIESNGGHVKIGAGSTLADILASRDLAFLHPVARSIGGPALRNMATIAGNLFAHAPHGDMATALLALEATLHWSDGQAEPIAEFFKRRQSARGVIEYITVQKPAEGAFRTLKISRAKGNGAAILTLACDLRRRGGRLSDVRLALGAMGPTPLRARAAEAALEGVSLDESGIKKSLDVLCSDLSPMSDALCSDWYRARVAPVYLRRLLIESEAL